LKVELIVEFNVLEKKGKRNRLFDIARENKRLLLFEEE